MLPPFKFHLQRECFCMLKTLWVLKCVMLQICIPISFELFSTQAFLSNSPLHRFLQSVKLSTVLDIKRETGEQNHKPDEERILPDVEQANSFIQIMEIITSQGKYHSWSRGGKGDGIVSQPLNICSSEGPFQDIKGPWHRVWPCFHLKSGWKCIFHSWICTYVIYCGVAMATG